MKMRLLSRLNCSVISLSSILLPTPCLAQGWSGQLSQGERIVIEDREFSIQPPWGWEVYQDYNGAMLYFQAPMNEGDTYQRNIRIMARNGPKYIDDMTFQNFGKEIVESSARISNAITDYRLRNQMPIEIAGGRKAGLYYAEFMIENVNLMQMHILVSSANFHFIMTFTDLMENFEANDSPHLNEAFASLQSVELVGDPPSRNSYFYWLVFGIGGLFVGLIALKIFLSIRVKRLAKDIDEFSDEESIEAESDHIEVDDSYVSGLSSKSRKKSKKKKAGLFKKGSKYDDEDMDMDLDMDDEEAVSDVQPRAKKKRIRIGRGGSAHELYDLEDTADIPGEEEDGWKF